MQRRHFLQTGSALGAMGLVSGCATVGGGSGPKVVVIGGGYSGATAAKYLRMWSEHKIQVTLVEPKRCLHLLPYLQPGDRWQQDHHRHHHPLRQLNQAPWREGGQGPRQQHRR